MLGVIDGAAASKGIKTVAGSAAPAAAGGAAPAASAGGAAGGDVVVNAPMDGEAVYMSFFKSVGDSVAKNEVVVEVE